MILEWLFESPNQIARRQLAVQEQILGELKAIREILDARLPKPHEPGTIHVGKPQP